VPLEESRPMKTIAISSIFVLFALVVGITATAPTAFADHATASVSIPAGTSVPGCEETKECYVPYTVTIDPGGEVTWSNDDSAAHTVTSGTAKDGPDGNFDSSLFMAGTTFSVDTLDEEGTYPYFCMVHPWMTGEVIVEAAGEDQGGDEELTVMVDSALVEDGTQINLEFNQLHVNYKITATQNGEVVLQETTHAMEMTASHMVDVKASEESPLEIEIVSLGVGPPGAEQDWTGPVNEVVATQHVVPEFGTIAMMILGISIVSIIAVTAKTRVIPRL